MNTSAIIMMIVGLGVTWGGAAYCMCLAMRTKKD
ncbi:MetS family NSS transporter small subunit [Pseudodesulfovibrio sp. JC047]|nr:MetS family NSS transporter small subunit [Pseudodesulfovibrio sp. JC047]NDV18909.1 MetS family NSS transporter small subunit [Pseudodesulfovibrio sp. JC047]